MTKETTDEVSITIDFDDAVQAIAYLSDLMDYMKNKDLDDAARTQTKHIETAKEICEAFCCEHFQKELGEE